MSALATTHPARLEQWASRGQIAAALGITKSRVGQRARNEKWPKRPGAKGRNGKPETEYLAPPTVQLELLNSVQALVARPSASNEDPNDLRPPTDEERAWITALLPLMPLRREKRPHYTQAKEIAEAMTAKLGQPCSPALVLKNCDKLLATGRVLPKPRSDKGKSRSFERHAAAAAWVIAKFTAERITNVRLLHEALVREWPNLRREAKDGPPGYDALRLFVEKHVSAPLRTYAHQGPDTYRNQHGPFIRRDHSQIAPMDWWVLDHRILDVDCRNTIFPTLKRDEMYRLHFTAVVDWGSRAWVGFCLSPQASWRTVGSALRMAISDYGFPKNLYWDNGEDFKKVQRMLEGDDQYSQTVRVFLERSGIELGITRALKYNARAKQIEAMFSAVSKRFDLIWGDAYQGSSTDRRSEYNEAAQKRHKKYLASQVNASPFPADVEVIAALAQFLYRENSKQRQLLEGRSRLEMLDTVVKKNAQPAVSRRMLDALFSERDCRKVRRGGCVQLENRWYEPVSDADRATLDSYQGREIVVLRDPYCLEDAVALDAENGFIADMKLQEFVAQSPNGHVTRDQVQACVRRERAMKRMYANYVGFFAALARSQGWKTEREVLLLEATNGSAMPAGAAPGALPALPERAKVMLDSPFVDDAAKRFIAAMDEDKESR